MDNLITIQALKYGNLLHYEWNTTLLEKTDSHIFVLGEYGRKLNHYTKQKVFTVEAWTIEYFSFDSWFTVSADVVSGKIQQFYCNINQPAKIKDNTVSFVDLDLDYIQRNGEWKVVDEDEFESNAIKFDYPEALIYKARQELLGLKELIRKKLFPFDGSLEKFVDSVPK
jgi:protein associated with RNAse G/E